MEAHFPHGFLGPAGAGPGRVLSAWAAAQVGREELGLDWLPVSERGTVMLNHGAEQHEETPCGGEGAGPGC